MIIDQIRDLINVKNFDKALKLISKELLREYDLFNPKQEETYTRLLALQATANTLSENYDDLVLDAVRREKYPSEVQYRISSKKTIILRFQNIFFLSCDAYINVIHEKKLFHFSQSSASDEFVKRLGDEMLDEQIEKASGHKLGKVLRINHPQLKAPRSYHIVGHYENLKLDKNAVTQGLNEVFQNCIDSGFSRIGMLALGFDIADLAKPEDKAELALEISNFIAELTLNVIQDLPKEKPMTIYFNFVRIDTFETFNRAFYRQTKMNPIFSQETRALKDNQQKFVHAVNTQNPDYMSILLKLSNVLLEESAVLLLGETGVGKSYLAKLIHKYSLRSKGAFVQFDCALLKADTNFVQIFGWKKGSFTDAKDDGVGLIEKAQDGTLFLDEIGNLDRESQKGLLTFLDEGTYRRYGDVEIRKANVRLIFGTNKDLINAVRKKIFAHDFYERIANRVYTIPPLRGRKEDISVFTEWLVDSLNRTKDIDVKIDQAAIKQLIEYDWPGNIRQLRYYVQNLYHDTLYDGTLHIKLERVTSNPPRNELYQPVESQTGIEKAILNELKKWNKEDGKFVGDYLLPIVAKVFKDDLKRNIKDTDKTLGISGTTGKKSPFHRAYLKYKRKRKSK